jgi:hypothetical protein
VLRLLVKPEIVGTAKLTLHFAQTKKNVSKMKQTRSSGYLDETRIWRDVPQRRPTKRHIQTLQNGKDAY